jgi:hypothetical protein
MPRLIENASPPYEPYVCAVTKRGEPNDYIDLETIITEEGHLFILKVVLENAAKTLCGMVPAEEVNTLSARLDDMSTELETAQEQLQALTTLKETLPEEEPVNA